MLTCRASHMTMLGSRGSSRGHNWSGECEGARLSKNYCKPGDGRRPKLQMTYRRHNNRPLPSPAMKPQLQSVVAIVRPTSNAMSEFIIAAQILVGIALVLVACRRSSASLQVVGIYSPAD